MVTYEPTTPSSGDVIEVDGRRVGDSPRLGEILEVLGTPERPRYHVRWDDDHESVLYPGGDTRIRRSSKWAVPTTQLVDALRAADLEFEVLPHRRTVTAAGEARALGVLPQQTAKTVVAQSAETHVRAVVPASRRVDTEKLAAAVDAPSATLLSEAELALDYPEFELGAVPPFGGRTGDRVVVDSALADTEYVVLDAGVHDASLRLRTQDLIGVAGAHVADIATG